MNTLHTLSRTLLGCTLLSIAALAQAAQWQIGAGSRVDFGDAIVNLSCADFKVDGAASANASRLDGISTLHIGVTGSVLGGQGQWALSGDFLRTGRFSADSSTISIVDTCPISVSRVSDGTVFHHLSVVSGTGKTLELAAGQATAVQGQLTLQGTAGNLLKVRSTMTSTTAQLSATTQQTVQFLDVADIRATGEVIAFGPPSQYQSEANGNLFRWFQFDAQGQDQGNGGSSADIRNVPSSSALGMAILSVLLILAGMAHLHHQRPQR